MARINQQLLERLQTKLGVGQARIYAIIDRKVQTTHLPRDLAALAVASDNRINISRYATTAQLAELRQARVAGGAAPSPPETVHSSTPSAAPTRRRATTSAKKTKPTKPANTVFVVHGRNAKARTELFKFLRALGLQPIEWNKAIAMTGEPSPYVGTILDVAFREAAAIVVLFTPDDEARLRKPFRRPNEPVYEKNLTTQARPNVLFEAGMAFGRNPKSTVLVQMGEVGRPFSDVAGRHIVHLNNSTSRRKELSTKLKNAGCQVDEEGNDWLEDAGDLEL